MNLPRAILPRRASSRCQTSGGMETEQVTVMRPRVEPLGLPLPGRFPPRFSVGDFMMSERCRGMEPRGVFHYAFRALPHSEKSFSYVNFNSSYRFVEWRRPKTTMWRLSFLLTERIFSLRSWVALDMRED